MCNKNLINLEKDFPLMDSIPKPVCLLNSDFRILGFNKLFEKFCKEVDVCDIELISRILSEKNIVLSSLSNDNKQITRETWVSFRNENRYLRLAFCFISHYHDIFALYILDDTEKQSILEERQELIKEKELIINNNDRFFSVFSHDLKGPLSGVVGLLSLFEGGNISEEKTKQVIKTVSNTAVSLLNKVNHIVEWYRINKGLEINLEVFNLNYLLSQEIEAISSNYSLKNIKLLSNLTKNILIKSDKNIVSSIVHNLMSNAIKFTKNGGFVMVDTNINNNFLFIYVKDNGIGISKQKRKEIFSDASISSIGTDGEIGTGLGLLNTRKQIELLGGELSYETNKPRGSIFKVKIPLK